MFLLHMVSLLLQLSFTLNQLSLLLLANFETFLPLLVYFGPQFTNRSTCPHNNYYRLHSNALTEISLTDLFLGDDLRLLSQRQLTTGLCFSLLSSP